MNNSIECKNIGVDWIGSIPSNWKVSRFKHLFDEKKSTKNPELNSGSISFGQVIYKNDESIPESTKEGYQEVLEGEFLINPLNLNYDLKSLRIALSRINVVVSQGYIVLKLRDHLHPNYYEYLLRKFDVEHMKSLGQGVRQTISFTHLKDENLVVPPIEEQKLISRYLDKKTSQIDSLVEKIQKKIELLKEQRTSLINHYVTKGLDPNVEMKDSGIEWIGEIPKQWNLIKLSHYTRIIRGSSPRPAGDPKLFGGDYIPWITVKEVTNSSGKFIEKTSDFLTEEGCKRSTLVKSGTLLFSNSGATLGVPRFTNLDGCINDGSVAFLDIRSCVDPEFLYYFLATQTTRLREEQKGFGQPNLNTEIVSNIKMPLPTIGEQRKIVVKIEETAIKSDAIIKKEENRLKLFSEYRQSLISSVVTGKVRVTEDMA